MRMMLETDRLSKRFGATLAVDDLTLAVERGELLCVLGASGCGKTTALNMIGGFEKPSHGRVLLEGRDITDWEPERRPISTVFQSYGLFAHMTALQNVAYGLKFRGLSRRAAKEKGMAYLELVGLRDRASARIGQLSGGQQQRVALARALIVEPKLCLLDEPFSNLDAALRRQMREELKGLQRRLGTTMLFVTHDQEEALILADRIAVMDRGRIRCVDTPRSLYARADDPFLREFLGADDVVWAEDGTVYKIIKRP